MQRHRHKQDSKLSDPAVRMNVIKTIGIIDKNLEKKEAHLLKGKTRLSKSIAKFEKMQKSLQDDIVNLNVKKAI